MTHICVGKLSIIGSDNGLSPGRRQAIIWTNAGISLIGPLRTNFSEILIVIQIFSFKKLHLKTSSAKWRLFCLGLNELSQVLSWEWRCSWSNADIRCSNYIWVINNFIACYGVTYIRGFTSLWPTDHDPYGSQSTDNGSHHWCLYSLEILRCVPRMQVVS